MHLLQGILVEECADRSDEEGPHQALQVLLQELVDRILCVLRDDLVQRVDFVDRLGIVVWGNQTIPRLLLVSDFRKTLKGRSGACEGFEVGTIKTPMNTSAPPLCCISGDVFNMFAVNIC